ncbi:MAG TPA: glycoside hydrolase family 38 C-terminal domain-containing protein [Armatimonadota bacterium]|jgi:alpha-mannosidase
MQTSFPVLVFTNNHFDPTWRRCWDRRFTVRGESYASYAELEDYYLTDNLALAEAHAGYKFDAESTIVVRKFVERHPEQLATLRRLAAAGRFGVGGTGDNIIDTNMVLGESIVRNMLLGLRWLDEQLGFRPRLGVRNDGFGHSAQLPQIFRGCDITLVAGLGYTPLPTRYWRGLDGSLICGADFPIVSRACSSQKYTPCACCRGVGCPACGQRGIAPALYAPLPDPIDAVHLQASGIGGVLHASEEMLPNPAIIAWVEKGREAYDIRFAIGEEQVAYHQRWLDQLANPPEADVYTGELNPNNSGVWVTRIKTKQTCRRQEYALLAAETLATLASIRGVEVPRATLHATWLTLLFTMFHDAVTATHIDAAYAELGDMWREIDAGTAQVRTAALDALTQPDPATVSVINLGDGPSTQLATVTLASAPPALALVDDTGTPADVVACRQTEDGSTTVSFIARDVPGLAAKSYRVAVGAPTGEVALAQPVIENARFRISADTQGLVSIFDKRLGRDIAITHSYRPNELILERDYGSPWTTLHPDRTRHALSAHTRLVAATDGGSYQRLTFHTTPRCRLADEQVLFAAESTVTLYTGLERVDFAITADWDAHSNRIRVAMPLPMAGQGVYGIPYGILARDEYAPTFHAWTGANGEWPAIDWAGVEGEGLSVALLNQGLPANSTETDAQGRKTLLLSILRSPTDPTYLHEPQWYSMTEYDGMRDAGHHQFAYALTAYAVPFAESDIVRDATAYNAGLLAVPGRVALPDAPAVTSDHVRIAALKPAEDGPDMMLRLWEYRGASGVAEVTLPAGVRAVMQVNLLEADMQPLTIHEGRMQLALHPWEITTLRLSR